MSIKAEELARRYNHTPNWSHGSFPPASEPLTTPLHHLTIIPAARAHALLRNGASILATARKSSIQSFLTQAPGHPTPLSLARELHAKGEAAENCCPRCSGTPVFCYDTVDNAAAKVTP